MDEEDNNGYELISGNYPIIFSVPVNEDSGHDGIFILGQTPTERNVKFDCDLMRLRATQFLQSLGLIGREYFSHKKDIRISDAPSLDASHVVDEAARLERRSEALLRKYRLIA